MWTCSQRRALVGGLAGWFATTLGVVGCATGTDEGTNPPPDPCADVADRCTQAGETRCSDDAKSSLVCAEDERKCLVWKVAQQCTAGACKGAGECPCDNKCTKPNATKCSGATIQVCVADTQGCLDWKNSVDCSKGDQQCVENGGDAECITPCTDKCTTDGQTRCANDMVQTCTMGEDGCRDWEVTTDCVAAQQVCQQEAGADATCVSTCVDTCPSEGSTKCVSDVISTCTKNAKGCLEWVETQHCGDTNELCYPTSPAPACCTQNCMVAGGKRCLGQVIQTCEPQADGCYDWVDHVDCAASGQVCNESATDATCGPVCIDACAGGALKCQGDTLQNCTLGTKGCYVWADYLNCHASGGHCWTSGTVTQCVSCNDECSKLGDKRCNGTTIEECRQGYDGCYAWQGITYCSSSNQNCEATGGTPQCVDIHGDTCADPIVVSSFPYTVSGSNITSIYTNALAVSSNQGCSTANGADVVFAVTVAAGQTIRLEETGGLDAVLRILDACDPATAKCLVSKDTPEQVSYTAPSAGTYYVVLEAYSSSPYSTDYSFTIDVIPPETNCGNGVDDDGDGKTDCADLDCVGNTVDCANEIGFCKDTLDNDSDNLTDCADPDCAPDPSCTVRKGYFEQFGTGDEYDLSGCTIKFTPNTASPNGYDKSVVCACIPAFKYAPGSGTVTEQLTLMDSSSALYSFTMLSSVPFYQVPRKALYVGSNGFITFGSGDSSADTSTTSFFEFPRIAGTDADLDPSDGGTVTVDEWIDRVAVTFDEVAFYVSSGTPPTTSFQIVLYDTGVIEIVHLSNGKPTAGIVGISNGSSNGTTPKESNFVSAGMMAPGLPGDVLFTEVHYNPHAVSDADGEFIEIYNPRSQAWQLDCCVLDNGAESHDIGPVTIAANGYLVLVSNANSSANGGITGGYSYGGDIHLSDGNAQALKMTCRGKTIDTLPFNTSAPWPHGGDGVSMQLSQQAYSATMNDMPAVWCDSTSPYPGATTGDLGTPGAQNGDCTATMVVNQSFETNPNWSMTGDWAWGTPNYSSGPSSCAGGTSCCGTNMTGTYSSGKTYANNYVQAGPFDFSSVAAARLQFDLWLTTESGWDFAQVQVSTNGTTFDPLPMDFPPYTQPSSDPVEWDGVLASGWVPAQADLSSFAGASQVFLRWALRSDSSSNYAGMYIDNVRLTTF